jgi:hypothetical protein
LFDRIIPIAVVTVVEADTPAVVVPDRVTEVPARGVSRAGRRSPVR